MHSDSSERKYFSEGEIYWMHFDDRSFLNWCAVKGEGNACEAPKRREGVIKCEDRKVKNPSCPGSETQLREDPK